MTEVLDHSEATGTTRCVLLSYADNADRHSRECWPGMEEVARRARCDVSTAKRCTRELIEMGELEVVRQGGGRGRRTVYRVPPLKGRNVHPFPAQEGAQPAPVSEGRKGRGSSGNRRESAPTQLHEPSGTVRTVTPPAPASGGEQEQGSGMEEATPAARDAWRAIRGQLAAALGDFTYATWIEPLELAGTRAGTLVLRAPDDRASWVRERFLPMIRAAASEHEGPAVELELSQAELDRAAEAAHRQQRRRRRVTS